MARKADTKEKEGHPVQEYLFAMAARIRFTASLNFVGFAYASKLPRCHSWVESFRWKEREEIWKLVTGRYRLSILLHWLMDEA